MNVQDLEQIDASILMADGMDDALVGVMVRAGQDNPVACYDIEKVIDILMARDGMTEAEAVEFFDFNILGSWVGDYTPCFIYS